MGIRDLCFLALIVGTFPWCFRRPFVGLLVFSLLAYMRVQDLTWGSVRYMRFSMYVALLMFMGWLVFDRRALMIADLRNYLMVALIVLVGISMPLGDYVNEYVTRRYVDFCKMILIALFTTSLVDSRKRLDTLCWVICISFAFYGVKNGLFGFIRGNPIIRGPGGLLGDNNDFALALVMGLPFIHYLGIEATNRRVKTALKAAFLLTIWTVILTHSRGGALAMGVTVMVIAWRSRVRVLAFAGLAVGGLVFLLIMPDTYKERMGTLKKGAEADSSAQARIKSWGIAMQMIRAFPAFGVGFNQFQPNYIKFDPRTVKEYKYGKTWVAHNSFLQIWSESGTIAFAVYLALFGSTLFLLARVRREAASRYFTSWISNYASMFEASLIGFMVGGMFLNRGHFDLVYHIMGMSVVFARIARAEMRSPVLHPERGVRGVRVLVKRDFERKPLPGFRPA